MSMAQADSTLAGVKVYVRIIIVRIIYYDTSSQDTGFAYIGVTGNVVFFLSNHIVTESDIADSYSS